jgi:hypothetical protein
MINTYSEECPNLGLSNGTTLVPIYSGRQVPLSVIYFFLNRFTIEKTVTIIHL